MSWDHIRYLSVAFFTIALLLFLAATILRKR